MNVYFKLQSGLDKSGFEVRFLKCQEDSCVHFTFYVFGNQSDPSYQTSKPKRNMCLTERAEVAKHFFLEDHPVLKMLSSSKVTDVLYRASMFRTVFTVVWLLTLLAVSHEQPNLASTALKKGQGVHHGSCEHAAWPAALSDEMYSAWAFLHSQGRFQKQ
ncbi:hypothetical protein EK904_008697 [Melospiza melodia maxima]|nr:hypothetical protein EK904_008697 [Melospiza melodia maxima]